MMVTSIADQVIDFYNGLFDKIFSEPFRPQITDRIRRNAVVRQVEESADAASQSLIRFFLNEQLTETQVANVLSGFAELHRLLNLANSWADSLEKATATRTRQQTKHKSTHKTAAKRTSKKVSQRN